jgi:hypothetical protein
VQLPDLLAPFITRLDTLGVSYMITGSIAGILYAEPRMTHDVDIVIDLPASKVGDFVRAFPLEHFYCPPEEVLAIEVKRRHRGHCNVIDHDTGFKADIYIAYDELHRWALSRVRRLEVDTVTLPVAPPEYVMIRKLEYLREGGSDKHVRDLRSMLEVSGDQLDREFLAGEITKRGLDATWVRVTAEV